MPTTFGTVRKALAILSDFRDPNASFTPKEVSRRHTIPLSSTYKYIESLEACGYLSRDRPSGQLRLGSEVLRLGKIAERQFDLVSLAAHAMNLLVETVRETAFLVRMQDNLPTCIECIESDHPARVIRLSVNKGTKMPFHAGAPSKVLLAYQSAETRSGVLAMAPFEKFTKNTITKAADLDRELDRIRRQGHAVSHGEIDEMASAIACPIQPDDNLLLGAVAVAGPSARLMGKRQKEIAEALRDCAKRISFAYLQQETKLDGRAGPDAALHQTPG